MFLSDLSIKRPVFAAVMMMTLVTLGIFSYRQLSIEMFPNIEFPVLSIVTVYPGAAPETVEREVTRYIEEAVNPISGVKRLISYSKESVSSVIVIFDLEVKINEASQEARAKINAISGELPADIEEPVIQKMDFGSMPVVSLAIRSDVISPRELTQIADRKVKRRLENIPGVGKVELIGESTREINILIDPSKLDALGMTVNEVIAGLKSENIDAPLGRITRADSEISMRISGKPTYADQFNQMVIAVRDGSPIKISDIAIVDDGVEDQRSLALIDGAPAITLDIMKQSGANTVAVVDDIKKELDLLKQELPLNLRLDMIRDDSVFIRDSLRDVIDTLIIGGLLTVLIVFIFLNSWRSTVITGLTLPISVISSFIIMNAMGMSLNFMTLMALSLAIGLLIDDAIVVRENIVRHLEHGKDHFTAAKEGTSEIGLAVLATSLSIISVFIPVAFMKGIVGRFFFHFGITIAFAVTISLFVSFTLDPMLSSRWFDPDIEQKGRRWINRLLQKFNDWFDRTADRYKTVIAWALDHRKSTMAAAFVTFILGMMLFGNLPSEFMTEFDQNELMLNFQTAPNASLDETKNRLEIIRKILQNMDEVDYSVATVGAGDAGTVRDATIYIRLKDKSERALSQQELISVLRSKFNRVPGIKFSVTNTNNGGQKPLELHLRGPDIDQLKIYAAQIKDALYTVPGIVDIEASLELDSPEYRLFLDREKAFDSGITSSDVARTVNVLLEGTAVTTFEDEEGEAIEVRIRLPNEYREDIQEIQNIRFAVYRDDETHLVPLSELSHYELSKTPAQITRESMTRQVVISANLDGLALGSAVQKALESASSVSLAPGYKLVVSGEAQDMAETFEYIAEALLLAIVLVYLILAAQFESFIDPFAIMLSLPLSIVGMAGMLFLTGDTLNIMSQIGLILLMGLVTKNAILLIDYSKVLRKRGMDRREAVILAGRTRLRPIIMTTLAMIFGMIPLALEIGAGAEIRSPMGRAVVGGLITSTMLTLIIVPVVYTLLDDLQLWIKKRWIGKREMHV